MERPTPGRIVLTLLLLLGLYGLLLPIWLSIDRGYGAMIASIATHVTMPLTGLKGSVALRPGENVQFDYVLHDPRTGGWARVPQRLLNGPELPLALAAAVAMLALPFRRRLILAALLALFVIAAHVTLVTVSAHRAAAILTDTRLSLDQVNHQLTLTLNGMNRVGDIAVPVVLALAALGAWFLRPLTPSKPLRSEPPSAC